MYFWKRQARNHTSILSLFRKTELSLRLPQAILKLLVARVRVLCRVSRWAHTRIVISSAEMQARVQSALALLDIAFVHSGHARPGMQDS